MLDDGTITTGAVIMAVMLPLTVFSTIIWLFFFHSHGRRRAYLPMIDLISYFLTGGSIVLTLSSGLSSFSESYPRFLESAGLSNISRPYAYAHEQLRVKWSENCSDDEFTTNCQQIQLFLDGSYAMTDEPVLVKYNGPIISGVDIDVIDLIFEYNHQHDIAPTGFDTAGYLFRHVHWLIYPMLFGYLLGLHRRWILAMHAMAPVASHIPSRISKRKHPHRRMRRGWPKKGNR